MNILGLNAYHGDASAAILRDGHLVAAVEEERLNRIKHWAGFPVQSARYCLEEAGGAAAHVAIARDPSARLWSKIKRAAMRPVAWSRLASRARNNYEVARFGDQLEALAAGVNGARLHHVEHHRAHLASAFFCSPYEEAAAASVDGFGDFSSAMWGAGRGSRLDVQGSVSFPDSLGLFYTAFTQFLGFPNYGDEYKMMGLAAYGDPAFRDRVREVIRWDGTRFRLNLDYFTHHTDGVEMTWDGGAPSIGGVYSQRFVETFGPARQPRTEITARDRDLAASVQAVLEEVYFAFLRHVHAVTQLPRLCLAGGVALNCAANGKLLEQTPFREVYIQAASHDAGTSIGAAQYVWHHVLGNRRDFVMRHCYWGPQHPAARIESALDNAGLAAAPCSEAELIEETAQALAAGHIVGWFQGRMEFGPRALGARSILADPRRAAMKDTLNARIKFREPFRPFCPSVTAEDCGRFFEQTEPSPFMVQAYRIRPEQRAVIPAVTHEDGTGRLQTVERDASPLYWSLIRRFGEITGVPVLINTSFNENEPIVNTPEQAVDCFLRTEMDMLAIGPFVLRKQASASAAGSGMEQAVTLL